MNIDADSKIRGYVGLCRAAGGITSGTELVLGEVRRGRAKLVLIADDASDRTKKQIADKCTYYKVKYCFAGCGEDALSEMIGKKAPCAAAAFTGKGPWKPVLEFLENGNSNTERMIVDGSKANLELQAQRIGEGFGDKDQGPQ